MAGAWKVAYADFVTAMMAFFLLLWVLSTVSPETKAGLAAYFKGELQYDSSATSPVSNNPFLQNTARISTDSLRISENEKSHIAIAQKLQQMLMADAIPQSASGIGAGDVGVQLRVNSDAMFQHGSAVLSPQGIKVLGNVIKILREYNLYLVVRGHADSAEAKPNYPSGWELSGARAAAALHYLTTQGIKPTTLRGICYGDTRPYKPGINEESKAANRRVEFVFHRPEVMSYSVVY